MISYVQLTVLSSPIYVLCQIHYDEEAAALCWIGNHNPKMGNLGDETWTRHQKRITELHGEFFSART
jgi:hypothetical protein